MDLKELREQRQKWMTWKNILPLREELDKLESGDFNVEVGDVIRISGEYTQDIKASAKLLMPWRKGPFELFDTYIDTEWKSNIKYKLLRPYFNLKDKRVADIGCNNGYYLFRMQEDEPKALVGFDPSPLYKTQFDFINHFVKSEIEKRYPDLSIQIKIIITKGDKLLDSPLSKIGGKGIFIKEIENALFENIVGIAVHSVKDIPTEIPSGLKLAAILKN